MRDAHRPRRAALAAFGLLAGLLGMPCAAAGDGDARTHLVQERRAIEATHAERQRQCAGQFVVTACVEAARAQRREALLALDAREAALDDAERRQRALDRQGLIDAKVARRAASASAPDRELFPLVPAERASNVRPVRGPQEVSPPPAPRASRPTPEEVKAREADSRARFEQREREAQSRREAAAQRQRQKVLSGKPAAAPLPALGASGADAR